MSTDMGGFEVGEVSAQPSAAWGVPKPPRGWIAHGTRSAWCWMPEGWIYGAIRINISVPNPVTTAGLSTKCGGDRTGEVTRQSSMRPGATQRPQREPSLRRPPLDPITGVDYDMYDEVAVPAPVSISGEV